jgi:hypothetical protein
MSTSDSFWLQFLFSLNNSCVKTWKHVYWTTYIVCIHIIFPFQNVIRNYRVPLFMKLACYSISEVKNIFIHPWLYRPLSDLGRFFSFLILYTVGKTPWTGDQPVASSLPTHRTIQIQNKRTQTSMPWVGFEPTIPAFQRAKRVHALDREATVTGSVIYHLSKQNGFNSSPWLLCSLATVRRLRNQNTNWTRCLHERQKECWFNIKMYSNFNGFRYLTSVQCRFI